MSIVLYAFAIAFLILFPQDTADTAFQAMHLWGTSIVPILFPYMVLSRMLCQRLRDIRFPAAVTASFLSILGGSPSGAAMIAANRSTLSITSLSALCAFCGTISPMFILGPIQAWVDLPSIGRRLLLCHWLSAILCSWIVWLICRKNKKSALHCEPETNGTPSSPLKQSIDAVLQIGGCVILYSVLAGIAGKVLHPFPALAPLVHAALEISGGIHAICQSAFAPETKCILIAAALGFSGFSVLSQNHAFLLPLGISMRKLILYALLRAALSAVLMGLYTMLLPVS